jgi:Tol biopolymer transport system component
MNKCLIYLTLSLLLVSLVVAGCGNAASSAIAPTQASFTTLLPLSSSTAAHTSIPTRTATLIPPTLRPSQTLVPNREDGRIAYTSCLSDDHNSCEIYVMNTDGSEPLRLTDNNVEDRSPEWSPDGSMIVFVSWIPDRGGEIFVMDDDGNNVKQLTDNRALDADPAWSPDGKKIAFVSHRDRVSRNDHDYFLASLTYGPSPPIDEIYVMNPDGSNQVRLTDNLATEKAPTWSPDGKKIVFISDRDGVDRIYTMNPDGSNPVLLSPNGFQKWSLSVSPDGAQIAFGATDGIFVLNVDGSRLIQLKEGWSSGLDWSLDGTKLVFSRGSQIYIMNADGSSQISVTKNEAHNYAPAWGPPRKPLSMNGP